MKVLCGLAFALLADCDATGVALAMEGGGWRAQSSDAGLISGMLSYLGQQDGQAPTLTGTGLLDRFDHFSTNSGSSWFFSSLAYSESYLNLIEGMAASPESAAAQMKTKWTTPFLQATNVEPKQFDLVGDIARDVVTGLLGKGDEDTLYLLRYFLATNTTWNAFAEVLLGSTASLGPDEPRLGSPMNAFAKDKVWMAVHSVLFPTGRKFARLYQGKVDIPEAKYVAKTSAGESIPLMIPAKFSIKMGAGESSVAPHEYVADTAISDDIVLDFSADIVPIFDEPSAKSAVLDARDFCDGALTDGAGQLPVVKVAAASSAFAGIAPVEGLLADEALELVDADLTPWASNFGNGTSFKVANQLVGGLKSSITRTSIKDLAAAKVHGVIDGGYTEGTGLAAAVAAGADEVLVVLNSNATNNPFHVEVLFKDGPAPVDPGSSSAIFPVFATESSVARSSFTQFHQLALSNTTYLKIFAVGTIQATTAENKYFGISAGRDITIHVVNLCSSLSIGDFVNFDNYDMLVQEVMGAILLEQNSDFVKSTLLPMFKGSAVAPAAVLV